MCLFGVAIVLIFAAVGIFVLSIVATGVWGQPLFLLAIIAAIPIAVSGFMLAGRCVEGAEDRR